MTNNITNYSFNAINWQYIFDNYFYLSNFVNCLPENAFNFHLLTEQFNIPHYFITDYFTKFDTKCWINIFAKKENIPYFIQDYYNYIQFCNIDWNSVFNAFPDCDWIKIINNNQINDDSKTYILNLFPLNLDNLCHDFVCKNIDFFPEKIIPDIIIKFQLSDYNLLNFIKNNKFKFEIFKYQTISNNLLKLLNDANIEINHNDWINIIQLNGNSNGTDFIINNFYYIYNSDLNWFKLLEKFPNFCWPEIINRYLNKFSDDFKIAVLKKIGGNRFDDLSPSFVNNFLSLFPDYLLPKIIEKVPLSDDNINYIFNNFYHDFHIILLMIAYQNIPDFLTNNYNFDNLMDFSEELSDKLIKNPRFQKNVCLNQKLSKEFIDNNCNLIDWFYLALNEKSQDLFSDKDFCMKYSNDIFWELSDINKKEHTQFIHDFIPNYSLVKYARKIFKKEDINLIKNDNEQLFWQNIIQKYQLSDQFIDKYINKFKLIDLVKYQKLSIDFIKKHIEKINNENLLLNAFEQLTKK